MENAREFLVEIIRVIAFVLGVPLDPILLMIMRRGRKK